MEKAKKFNVKNLMIAVLSVLLLASVAVGGTMAWFAAQDTANATLTMGGSVLLEITDSAKTGTETMKFTFGEDGSGKLVPGAAITPEVYATLKSNSTQTAFLRATVNVKVSGVSDDSNTIKNAFIGSLKSAANAAGWGTTTTQEADGKFYYVGTSNAASATDETALVEQNCTTEGNAVAFLTKKFQVPTTWDNNVANATITITITIDAIQSELNTGTADAPDYAKTIAEVEAVLNPGD